MRGGSRTQASWFTSQTSWGKIFYLKGQVIYSSFWERKAVHIQHSWWAVRKSFSSQDGCFLGNSSCEGDSSWWLLSHSCCLSQSHLAQCQSALARNRDRSLLAPTSVGAKDWFGMLPVPHSQILLHFCCHPSVSMATLPAVQPPMHCVCATPKFYTPYLVFWVFSSVYVSLCFPSKRK